MPYIIEFSIPSLHNGIKIGDRHYEFLAFSASQLRDHSCWFFAPNNDLTANDIRNWMKLKELYNFVVIEAIQNVVHIVPRFGKTNEYFVNKYIYFLVLHHADNLLSSERVQLIT